MAFNFLQNRMNKAIKNVSKRAILSSENISEVLNEIKLILLEADVNLKVVNNFIEDVRKTSIGEVVGEKNTSSQLILKIINEKLVDLFGSKTFELEKKPKELIMFVGLQGSGKTTTSAKLANYLLKKSMYKKPLLVGLDVYRPAAIDQLEVLANQIKSDFYSNKNEKNPLVILEEALKFAEIKQNDLIILDTAGRLQTDEKLMKELSEIKKLAKPSEIILTIDAMYGQEIINIAKEFNDTIKLTGTIITKLDSDAKGGAVLSIKSILNVPVLFVGVGEKMENLEVFHPDRMVSRILGLGDIKTLTEKTHEAIDENKQEKIMRKMLAGNFDLEDLLDSIMQLKKMGNFGEVMKMMPGIKHDENQNEYVEQKLVAYQALINSMTMKEKRSNNLLNHPKRKNRILAGSGRTIQEYNELLRRFEKSQKQIKELVKQLKSGKMPNFGQNLMN